MIEGFIFVDSFFVDSMTVLTMKFQVYLMYILGNTGNQSSNFCNFLTFGSFFEGMQFFDDVTG